MKREEAVKLVKRLAAAYPSWKPDRDTADIWAEEFMEIEDERVTVNMKEWLRRGEKFMPSLAEMIAPHPDIEAEKATARTNALLKEQEERSRNAVPPPWTKEPGMTREEWMRKHIANAKKETLK